MVTVVGAQGVMIEKELIAQVQTRLRKYDPVRRFDLPSDLKEELKEKKKVIDLSAEDIGSIMESVFLDKRKTAFNRFYACIGHDYRTAKIYGNVSKDIRNIFAQLADNLEVFLDKSNSWDLYKKDVIRGVAYHEWIEKVSLSELTVINGYHKGGGRDEYRNVPIDITYSDKSTVTIYCNSLGGGLLSSEILSKKSFYDIFKCNETVFNSFENGLSSRDKEKGISYKNYRKLLGELLKKDIGEMDIWFLKNTLDPELVVDFGQMIKKRSITRRDRKLINILSKCMPPSIRLYLFEAVKPAYQYMQEVLSRNPDKENRDKNETVVFDKLQDTINGINQIYILLVETLWVYLQANNIKVKDFLASDTKLCGQFCSGDDFPMLRDVIKVTPPRDGFLRTDNKWIDLSADDSSKSIEGPMGFMDYIPEEENASFDKISFYIITALNDSWEKQRKINWDEDKEELEVDVEATLMALRDFKSRLFSYITIE